MRMDLLINGNLICSGSCKGYLVACFNPNNSSCDMSQAIVIEGDVHVKDFDAADKVVGVTGYVKAKVPKKEVL